MLLNKYIQQEEQLNKLQQELEVLKSDPRLAAELEFKDKVLALMAEYGKNEKQVIALLDPSPATQKGQGTTDGRSKRRLKRYVNPHTNEQVETRGGNHKTIREWKEKHGEEAVNSWFSFID